MRGRREASPAHGIYPFGRVASRGPGCARVSRPCRKDSLDEPAEAERRLREVVTRYKKTSPQLAAWLEENVPEALTVLRIPAVHRRRLRTTNGLEQLNKEIKRRRRVATLFLNEASLLRLASAVLSESSDDW
jgi:transposase-like protein